MYRCTYMIYWRFKRERERERERERYGETERQGDRQAGTARERETGETERGSASLPVLICDWHPGFSSTEQPPLRHVGRSRAVLLKLILLASAATW